MDTRNDKLMQESIIKKELEKLSLTHRLVDNKEKLIKEVYEMDDEGNELMIRFYKIISELQRLAEEKNDLQLTLINEKLFNLVELARKDLVNAKI